MCLMLNSYRNNILEKNDYKKVIDFKNISIELCSEKPDKDFRC